MKLLGGILKTFVLLAVLGFVAYKFLYFFPVFSGISCDKPIPYSIGTFDERFDVTEQYFLDALKGAEAIWEKPAGRNLFVYLPDIDSPGFLESLIPKHILKVNLIYDYRQEATGKLEGLGIVVKDTQESYDSLKAKFEAAKREYEREKGIFNTRVAAFDQKNAAYEKEVNFWNKKGGAPEAEFKRLESTRLALEAEKRELDRLQARINGMVGDVNAIVVGLNRLAGTLNLTVERYNAINETRGESFEEGVYVSEGAKREINIYEWESREKLLRVLAHEFGHALSLEHVPDEEAIMYEFNQGDTLMATEADLAELARKCDK